MTDQADAIECVACGFVLKTETTAWPSGWGCLYGQLAVCSVACAEAYAATSSYGKLRDGDVEWVYGPPNEKPIAPASP